METTNDEITLKEILVKAKEWYVYLLSKKNKVILAAIERIFSKAICLSFVKNDNRFLHRN